MNDAEEHLMSVFSVALERGSAGERQAYLDQACADDPALRARVEALLRAHDRAGGFLGRVPDPAETAATEQSEGTGPTADLAANVVIAGRYRMLERIGEGGMGEVYLAQQTEPIRRLVAVKLVKPGMDSRQVLARFEAERQALAMMDHANIAKVLDAGATPEGRPYFVMELVKGVPITTYSDDHRLEVRERLVLFADVCRAVQHAHQKGVIHRDIKPSNVLVAPYDGKPVVKVIDFGVAKAVGSASGGLTERTLLTGLGAVVGTPEYMSPEQAELNNLDIDTRSDIYALGVLLYELLTGTTPLTRRRMKEAVLLEILRVIREEEPPRPSARLSTTEELPSIAAVRGVEPARLSRLVRGELDWIVMKALEKDRNRRYETANALASDVQRYLTDVPVQACPPSTWYRLRKFARRNKTALAVAGLIVLFMALLGSGWIWVIRDRALRQAEVARGLELALDRADLFQGEGKRDEVLTALDRAELLAGQVPPDPERDKRLAALREWTAAEQRDQQFIARFEEIRLKAQSQVNVVENRFVLEAAFPEIKEALRGYGIAIKSMAPAEAGARILGRPEAIRRDLLAALDVCLDLAPEGDSQTRQWLLATLGVADSDRWRVRARKAVADRDWKTLEPLARDVDVRTQSIGFLLVVARSLPPESNSIRLELLRRIQRAYPADLWANHELADELRENDQPVEAIRYYHAAVALRPVSPGIYLNRSLALKAVGELDAAIADARQALVLAPRYASAHNTLGLALTQKDRLDEAIAEFREAIRLKTDYAEPHANLGYAFLAQGRIDDGLAEFHESNRLNPDLPGFHTNLGNALWAKGQADEAIAEFREAIRTANDHIKAHTNLCGPLLKKGLVDEAIAECRMAIQLKPDYAPAHDNLGNALTAKGRLDEAIAEFRHAICLKPDFAAAHTNLGIALLDKKLVDDAIAEHRKAIQAKSAVPQAHHNLGVALAANGQREQAIAEFREAIRLKKDYAKAHYCLGNELSGTGQTDEAIAEYQEAIRIDNDFAEAHCNLGLILRAKGRFGEALEEVRRGHELGSRLPGWSYPSLQWVRESERLVELDAKLPGVLAGATKPVSPDERIELARLASFRRLNRAAARLCEEAFAADSKLANDLDASNRYNAACAAALAGSGQGEDADKLDSMERGRLRREALDWLRADLNDWRGLLDEQPDKNRAVVVERMRYWQEDIDFAGVRGPKALAKLPETEREAWQKLWDDVASTLARAQANTTPEKSSGAR
jgi:serine/threonine protein kinase/tetratricopeptide (TPR) repeat protein